MSETNKMLDVLLHLGYEQLKDGLCEDAFDTFSAAHLLDVEDARAKQACDLASARIYQAIDGVS